MIEALALIALLSVPAHALPQAEQDLLSATGRAIVQMMNGDAKAARAVCGAARKALPENAPAYLAAYTEDCLAITAAPFGPGPKGESCRFYSRAIDIWTETPPPEDDDESRLGRARKLKSWRKALADNCPDEAPKAKKAKKAASVSDIEGGSVITQEGLAYDLPAGWSVAKFDETSGAAELKGPDGYTMRVERTAAQGQGDYAETETLPGGAALEHEHKEFLPNSGSYVLYARLRLKDDYVKFGMGRQGSPEGVEKERGLAWLREIAARLKVLGPRRCIGNCGPGMVKRRKKAPAK